METVSTAGTDDGNLEPQSGKLARLLVELVRAGYTFTFQLIPNEWGAIAEAEVVFERTLQTEPVRTMQEDFEALKEGKLPQAPIRWKFDPFEPLSLYKAIKRFHHLFVENQRPQ